MIEINGRKLLVIGEVKTLSPFGFVSNYSWDYLFNLTNTNPHVDVISVHTHSNFGGNLNLLERAQLEARKSILAKGEHKTDKELYTIFRLGVKKALVVGRIPDLDLLKSVYLEPTSLEQLSCWRGLPDNGLNTVVWNSRDLKTGGFKGGTPEEARRMLDEARKIWSSDRNSNGSIPRYLIQASNIKTIKDIHPLVDGILVGAYLPQFLESLEK